jgi:hypothetical protein
MTDMSSLSPAQVRFADAHESHDYGPTTSSGCIFMYREERAFTQRWLVAPDGTELEWERFRCA